MIDNYSLFEQHERTQSKYRTCDCCDKILDMFAFDINGDILCEDCMIDQYRVDADELEV